MPNIPAILVPNESPESVYKNAYIRCNQSEIFKKFPIFVSGQFSVNVESMTPGMQLRPTSDETVANLKSSMKENGSNYTGTQLHGIANVPSWKFDKEKVGLSCIFFVGGGDLSMQL